MKAVLALVLAVVLVGAGLKVAGARLPMIDYPIGPIGVDSPGPGMPNVQIEPPGYDLDLP